MDSDFSDTNLAEIFSIDSGRGITTLRVSVSGDKPVADAVTLLLYGFRRMQGMDDVPTTKLMAALALSGPAPDRIDRHVAAYVKSGLLIQTGRLKGTKYRLTNLGLQHAAGLITELLKQFA